ncbi:MAG: hypothetical protein RLZZ297_230 [Chloroflexota bacterium]|jgi:RsiW-degrading membrane proteinase PrsW (M82 family)
MSQAEVRRPSIAAVWGAGVGVIVVVAIAIAVLTGISSSAVAGIPDVVRVAILALLSFVPAATWLAVVVYQDRQAPEPRAYVIGLFLLGVAAAGGFMAPLVHALQLTVWADSGTAAGVAAGFVHGAVGAALIYAIVRWTVLPTGHFDQQMDGLVYAVAVAMGMATSEGLAYLLTRSTTALAPALQVITVDALLLLAVGTLVGFVLSLLKLSTASPLFGALAVVGGGVVIAAGELLDGLVPVSPLGGPLWESLLPAMGVMAVVLALVTVLTGRQAAADETKATQNTAVGRADVPVVLLVVVTLLAGMYGQQRWLGATVVVQHGALAVSLPQGLIPQHSGVAYPARDRNGYSYALAQRPSAGSAAVDIERERAALASYCHVYPATETAQGTVLEYVCLPADDASDATHGYTLVSTDAQTTYTITVSAAAYQSLGLAETWGTLLATLTPAGK